MRTCPSVEGSASPLITHRIGVEVCLARQNTFFHKCHRCIYRGQPANWEPAEPLLTVLHPHAPEEAPHADQRIVERKRPAASAPAAGRKKGGKTVDVTA